MNNRSIAAAFLFALAAVACAVPAHAESDDSALLPPLTPKGQYLIMTQDDATSSSKCIGNPVTPLCAVETIIACYHREIDDLCRAGYTAGHWLPGLRRDRENIINPSNVFYRVTRREILDDRHFPWKDRHKGVMQAGEIRVDIAYDVCFYQKAKALCGQPPWFRSVYIVRKENDHWAVVAVRSPDDRRYND